MAKKKNNMLVDFIENFKKVLNTPEQSNQQTNTSTNQKSTFQLPTRSTWQSFQNDRQQRENVANNILSTNRNNSIRNNSMATKSTAEMLNNNNFFSNLNNNFRNLPTSTKRENINAKGIQTVINAREQAKNLPLQEEKEQKEEQTTPKTNTIPINTNTGSMNMTPGQVGIQHKNAYGKQTDITKTPEYQQIKSSYNEIKKKAESGDEEAKQVVEQANKLGLLKEENKSKIAEFINKKNQEGNLHVLSQEEIDQRKSEAKKRLSLGGIKNWNLDSVIDYITDFSKLSSDLHAIGAPDFVTKPLDAIAPAGATVKTYGHHVETGVSNAVNALEKDKKHLYEDTFLGDIVPETYKNAQIESAEKITKTLDEYANQMDTKNAYNSSVANNNKVWGYFNDHFAPTLGEMTPSIIANMLVPETQVPATVTQFFVSKGSYYRDAEQRGMNPEEAMWYSNIMGFVEAGTEALTLKNAKKIGAGVKELTNGTLKKSVKDVGLKQTLKNLGGEATKEATNSLLKDTAIGMFENAVQESLTEPINEFVAQLTGGEDAADWSNMKERMIQAGTDGALLEFILGGVHAGVPSAQTIKGRIDSNITQNQAPLKGITTADITKMADDVSKVIDTEQIVKNQAEQTKAKLNDYLLSKGVESTSVIDKSKIIDEKLGTNLSEDVKKAVNSGKLDKNTYQELNNKLDQVVQAENTDDLYKHAERLDDILELKDTKQSLTGIVEKLSKENRLNDELSQNLKAAFTEIDNQMPYVAETSDNKKIDVFREDMMNFMNNSERAHNFAKSVESIIEKTGLNIRLNNELASDENGRIFNQNGETIIEINPNSESAGEFILMHELTHAIGNQDLKQTILDYANKNKEFETALKDFEARYGQTDITEEVMADISGQLLGNEEFINSLAQEQPSKFKQIYNAVKSWVKKFTGTYGYEDFVRDVEIKWRKAYEQNKNSITENIDQKILNNKTTLEEIPLFSKSANNNIIEESENNSDSQAKLPKEDNQGRTLSKEQQEYFKDSKVRDKDGNLLTVYHGTNSDFNIFDITKGGQSNEGAAIGFWFTETKQGAENFAKDVWYGDKKPQAKEVYLNIKNPKIYENVSNDTLKEQYRTESENLEKQAKEIRKKYNWENSDYKTTMTFDSLIRDFKNAERTNKPIDFKSFERYAKEGGFSNEQIDTMEKDAKQINELLKKSKKANNEYNKLRYGDAYEQFKIDLYEVAGQSAEDANTGGLGMMLNNPKETVEKFRNKLIKEGYDGIIIKGTQFDNSNFNGENNQYVIFDSNQAKNINNTNPTSNPDIRYSKQSDKWQEWLEKNFPSRGTTTKFSDILLPNANIQNNNNTQTNAKPASDSVINKIEQGLKDIYPVDLDNEQLKEIATNIANNPTEEGILEALKDYRTAYLEDETADNEIIKEIKSTIRNTKLDVSNLKNSITDYNDLRKANFGKLKLGNDGSKIDTFYQELSSTYPDYFDSEISNEADQLDAIIDFINEDQTTKTEYQMTDEDIINSGLIDAVTTALNTEQTETIKETPKEAVKETTENDLIKRNKELYKQRYNLEKEAQRLDRKIELTDNEKGIVKSLLNGDITIDEIPTRYAEHKDSIIQKYQNDKALNEVRSEIKKNKEQSKSVYNTTADEVVKNLSKFKDKSKGILYRRETAIRNIQDVVKDKVLADKINNTYFKPVLENEAARTRYINDNMQKINDLKIDTKKTYPYSNPMVDKNGKKYMENLKINEADIAGLYLEKKISDDYLTKNHIDKARIEKIADTFKSILDDGINNMETEVMKAGYAPIGRIENYFPHFMETRPDGLIGKISNFIGIRTKVKSLPTEIAGKTDTFKPGKTWNQNALHREGDITDINALKAMENYINGASDVIYHTDDIQKLRALERSIRESYTDKETQKSIKRIQQDTELTKIEKEEAINQKLENIRTEIPNFVTWLREYTDVLANKKSQSDRNMEYTWGRQTYTTMQDIESKIASNMIGGNLSVSLTNFAPLSQAMGTTKVGNVLIGMLETTQNTIKNVFGNGDNFVDSSDFLTRRRGTETIHKLKASEKLSKVLGKPMEIIDNFTSEAIVRAKYRENVQNGMTEMEALKNADEYTANLMADRSKGALPTLFNAKNPISKLVTMFQVEPNNILSNYTKDWRNYNGNKAVAIAKLTVASYAFNTILKSLRGGSDILPDPINIVSQLIKMMTTDDEEEKKKAQDELISSITGSIPFGTTAAVLGQALGLDIPDSVQNSGRMPIASAIPNWRKVYNGFNSDSPEYKAQEFYREFMKPLLYLGLPTGGAQINKTIEGLKAYEKGGSYKYNSKGEKLLQFPVKQNMTNLIKSATFGKYSTPEGQEYATNFDAFNAKQTKLYDETDIDYKDLKKYYKDTKGQKDLAKMQYVDNMDISDDDKVELYKSDILSEKQAENLDYALDHKITTKKTFDNEYQKLQEKNISLPTKEDYQMMNSADISLKNYSDYKVATKGLKTEAEKNKALRNLSCSSKTKQAIYENTTGKDDETYQSVKNVISINNYLDYKSQKFVADKDENGKTISGSRKQKLIDYLNSNRNMNYQEKLIILGMNNKLSSGELTVVFNYVNSQKLTAKQKIAILKKVKGFKINGNNISW